MAHEMGLLIPSRASSLFERNDRYSKKENRQIRINIRIDPHSEFSLGPPGDSEISPGGGVGGRPGAVAPRPRARSWRRATPGRPGLTLTRSVDLLDRNPNTPPDGLVGDIPVALESAA